MPDHYVPRKKKVGIFAIKGSPCCEGPYYAPQYSQHRRLASQPGSKALHAPPWRQSAENTKEDPFLKRLLEQIMKFGIVGFIAFFIDYGLMVLLTELFSVDYLLSATISFTVSVIFNYLASMRYVFSHKEGMSRRREFIIFIVLSIIGLGINDALMWLGTDFIGIDYRITKIGATAVVMVWNFVTRKIFLDGGK